MNGSKSYNELLSSLYKILSNSHTDNMSVYDLQIDLLNCIKLMENKFFDITEKISLCKSENPAMKKDKIALGEKIKQLKSDKINVKEEIKNLKKIGDSVAYHYFSKYDLKNLGLKQDAGFIFNKSGLQKELEMLKGIFENGGLAILNDLTNSIRYGDITELQDHSIILHEVKSSGCINKRILRQNTTRDIIQNYLSKDYIQNFQGDKDLLKIPINEKNYIEELNSMIVESIAEGSVFRELEDGLIYHVMYGSSCKNELSHESMMNKVKENKLKIFYLNAVKYMDKDPYTPLLNVFYCPEFYLSFLYGDLIICIFYDMNVFIKKLQSNGISVLEKEQEYELTACKSESGSVSILMSKFFFNRLGRDFWSIDNIVNFVLFLFESYTKIVETKNAIDESS